MTSQEQFRRIDELFQAVCELPESEREARLVELAPAEPAIRSEVLALLLAEHDTSMTPEAVQSGIAGLLGSIESEQPVLRGYSIVGKLGAGGMGVVYEAEQEHPRRRVALKVLRSGLVSPELIRRFEYEADALGRLQHPAIAQVYEAGMTANSRPYFAMEFVDGQPLDTWARSTDVSRKQKLELFASVCDAVQHAHSKGVIHRDLKPANILVSSNDEPKVLDFGVARISDPARESETTVTQAGQLLGTLPYMSPEQLSGRAEDVDTRSDVFALGVVLYEMLGGRLPLDVRGMGVLEAARVIEHDQPPALSTLDPRCRGDLETIASTAMSKDRTRRYATAAALADDIRRHLAGDTITARPASAIYQFSRFARRHRAVVAAGTAVVLTLALGIVGTSWGLAHATRQADIAESRRIEAERQTRVAEQTVSFLNNDVLAAVVPSAQGKDVTVREALEASALTIGERFQDEPVIGATIRNNIGNVFHAIGELAAGESLIREAGEIFEQELGPADLRSIEARIDLAKIIGDQGRIEEAARRFEELSESVESLLGPTAPPALQLLVLRAQLAIGAYGDSDTARTLLDRFEERRVGVLDDDNGYVTHAAQVRGDLAFFVSDYAEAEVNYRKTYERHARELGETHPATLVALHNIAAALEGQNRHEEAQLSYLRVLEIERERSGWDHPDVLVTAHNLAFSYESTGRYDEAEPIYLDTLERCRRVFGPSHPGTLTCTGSLSSLYRETGRLDEAEALIVAALAEARTELGDDAEAIRSLEGKLGVIMLENGKPADAEPYLRTGLSWSESVLPEGHPRIGSMLLALGTALGRQNGCAEAIDLAERARVIFEAVGDEEDATRASLLIEQCRDRLSDESEPG